MRPLVYIEALYQLPSDHVMPGSVVQPTRAKLPNGQLLKARLNILSEPPDKPWQTLSQRWSLANWMNPELVLNESILGRESLQLVA
jgi:hypothetical protein